MPNKCRPLMLGMVGPRIALRLLTGRMDPETISEQDTETIGLRWHEAVSGGTVRPRAEDIMHAAEDLIMECLTLPEELD